MKVRNVMSRRVRAVNRSDTLKMAVSTLTKNNISGCPVIDSKKKVVGIITQTDISKVIDVHSKIHKNGDILDLVLIALKNEKYDSMKPVISKIMKMPVKSVMNKCVTISPDEDVYEAAKLMNHKNISRLPVVERGVLIGIVTKSDLMKLLERA
jgi:CBS domain-containing protein